MLLLNYVTKSYEENSNIRDYFICESKKKNHYYPVNAFHSNSSSVACSDEN